MTRDKTSNSKGILNNTFNQGSEPLPQRGPINMAKLDINLLTAWPKPWTSSDNNFENRDRDMSKSIGILARSNTVPIEKDHKFDRSSEKTK